jgi:hypothetical protein
MSAKYNRLINRGAALMAAAMFETDKAREAQWVEQSADLFVAAINQSWAEKIAARKMLLAEAERLLDAAEGTRDEGERSRLLGLFELYIGAAEAQT